MPTRLQELLGSIPPTTLGFTGLCVGVYVLTYLQDVEVGQWSIMPYLVIYMREWYRIITSALLHGGLMHIAMNMLSFQAMGTSLEQLFGSLQFFILIVGSILLSGVVYVTVCWALAYGVRDIEWLLYNSVGFSGVLFTLAALESTLSPAATRSIFGLITVPTRLYPWALLIALQVLMPNISFVGHLAGLLVGVLYSQGLLKWFFPSAEAIQAIESMEFFARIKQLNGYVPCPDGDPVAAARERANGNVFIMALQSIQAALMPVWNCIRPMVQPAVTAVGEGLVALRRRFSGGSSPAPTHTDWGQGVLGDGGPDDRGQSPTTDMV